MLSYGITETLRNTKTVKWAQGCVFESKIGIMLKPQHANRLKATSS